VNLYLCGPMTHKVAPNLNKDAFDEAASRLRQEHEVVNPAENPETWDYATCMRADIEAVLDCDAVVVLPRWEEGVGTRVEVSVALAIGTPVLRYDLFGGLPELYSATAGRYALYAFLKGSPA
jgi:hypothetical protein